MENVRKHLSLLGKKVEDKVTGSKGVVDSILKQRGMNDGQ